METTQKTREEAAQKEKRQSAPVKRRPAAQDGAPPPSAQQNNGAARTAEEQKKAAAAPRKPRPKQEEPSARPVKKAEPAKKKAPAKREEAKKAPAGKKAPAKKAPPAKKRPARKPEEEISSKKRAYGNSKPKKKTTVEKVTGLFKQQDENQAGKSGKRPKQPTPAVIYTQPQAFNRNRLFVQLLTAVAIVAALVMGLSVFFKVEHITVSGAEVYSEWAIREASGVKEKDNLLTFSHARAAAQIKANLPYVDTVRFGIKLPDTVNIIVKEDDVVYSIKDSTGTWWLMNSDGRVVEMGNDSKASNHTKILGVTLENPMPDEHGIATEAVPTETDESGEFIPVTTTGAQRLNAAMQILKALEANDIVGSAASVDVTRIEDIILWYGSRYQVNLGDSTRLDYKIACMNDVILQMSDYQSGILDISFTIWPNQVGYTPFA